MRTPRYQPIVDDLSARIRAGGLPPGTQLPTVRALMKQHGIALATAARVYAELEAVGLVVGETGRGIYAKNYGADLDGNGLSIVTKGVTGDIDGIYAFNNGFGALSIVAKGDVVGTASYGIDAVNIYPNGGPLSITTYGMVTGGYIATGIEYYYHTNLMQTNTLFISGSRFPWTGRTASCASCASFFER